MFGVAKSKNIVKFQTQVWTNEYFKPCLEPSMNFVQKFYYLLIGNQNDYNMQILRKETSIKSPSIWLTCSQIRLHDDGTICRFDLSLWRDHRQNWLACVVRIILVLCYAADLLSCAIEDHFPRPTSVARCTCQHCKTLQCWHFICTYRS